MKPKWPKWIALPVVFACASSLSAHHSSSLFDVSRSVWVKGTVIRFEAINPHSMIWMEERTEDGQIRQWTVEGPRLGRLAQLSVAGDFLKVGDVIEVCGFFYKEGLAARDPFPDTRVHGRVLMRADGEKWLWGPYGRLENCIDPDEFSSIQRGTTRVRDDEVP